MKDSMKSDVKKSKRRDLRKTTHPLELSRIVLGPNNTSFSHGGSLIEVSESGFKLLVSRSEIRIQKFRDNLDLSDLVGENIWIHLDDLDLIIEGTIVRTRFLGKGLFELGIDYSHTAPDYWRECLVDLLPNINDIE
jgi:hypothetical protein